MKFIYLDSMKFRVARHTMDLQKMLFFYVNLVGLEILGSFTGHDDYNGVFIGKKDLDWHLEFTSSSEAPQHHSDEDDLLVFYCSSNAEYDKIQSRLADGNVPPISSKNPYWNVHGSCYKDPDGFRIILVKADD